MGWRWLGAAVAAGGLVWQLGGDDPGAAPPLALARPPATVLLVGQPDDASTEARVYRSGVTGAGDVLGRVDHAPGAARRGVLVMRSNAPVVFVVAGQPAARGAGAYNSALFRVAGGHTTRLADGVTDASAPMVTEGGTLVVQRGVAGEERALDATERRLRERRDALSLDAVDPDSGAVRTVWRGRGQIAYLACALRGDEVLVYHVDDGGAQLVALDAGTGATRTITGLMPPLARDFSFDRAHDEVVFVQAHDVGGRDYDVVAVGAHGGAPRAVFRAPSDHLMPRVLSDGAVALSLPGDHGLGLLARAGGAPRSVAPLGDGSDAVVGESADGAWLAVRHTEPYSQVVALVERSSGRAAVTSAGALGGEWVGFMADGGAP